MSDQTNQPTKPRGKGGRPRGSLQRFTKEAREKAMLTGLLPHEFLLAVSRGEAIYRDFTSPTTGKIKKVLETYTFDDRLDAAKAAAPYFAPKISTVEVIHGVSDHELDAIIARAATEAGISLGTCGESEEGEAEDDPRERTTRRTIIR